MQPMLEPNNRNVAWRFWVRPMLVACVVACLFVASHGFRSAWLWRLVGDKVPHAAAYTVLAALMILFGIRGLSGVGMLMGIAAVDELTQPWFGRSCTLGDWLMDVSAIVAVYGLFALVRRLMRRGFAQGA